MTPDPMFEALNIAEGAIQGMIEAAASVEAEASLAVLRSETRAEFLGHLDLAALALQNGEVAKRAMVALSECRAMLAGPSRGLRAKATRRRVSARLDRLMAEIAAVIPTAARVQ